LSVIIIDIDMVKIRGVSSSQAKDR